MPKLNRDKKETLSQMMERIRLENEALKRLINALQDSIPAKKSQKQNQ